MRNGYVYILESTSTDGLYVGVTCDPVKRWRKHVSDFRGGNVHKPLYDAMSKYGVETFTMSVIEIHATYREGCLSESSWIKYLKEQGVKIYNCYDTYDRDERGFSKIKGGAGPGTAAKVSAALKGRPRPQWVKDKISATRKTKQIKLSPEAQARQAEKLRGRKHDPEIVARRAESLRRYNAEHGISDERRENHRRARLAVVERKRLASDESDDMNSL